MPDRFELVADYEASGDQPKAVDALVAGLERGDHEQTLLGVTGSGKTFTMANVVAKVNRPTLVLAHNKTLAAQLCGEFKQFFPNNAVEFFVSYYDYYQPEAYIPRSDTYIAKESDINDEIDRLRHAASRALFERRDVLIVASVSCIYGLGEPEEYQSMVLTLEKGQQAPRTLILRKLVDQQYERDEMTLTRGRFRVRGDTLTIYPAYEQLAVRIEFWDERVERIVELDPLTGEILAERDRVRHLSGEAFCDDGSADEGGGDGHRDGADRAVAGVAVGGADFGGGAAGGARRGTTWRRCGRWGTARGLRITRVIWRVGRRVAGRGHCWIIFRRIGCCSLTRVTCRFRRYGGCTGAIRAGSRRWWIMGFGCRRRSIIVR